ncbi:hypothetical protein BJF79_12285 [Actinomadura sp. CNU-125]|nr:hypothetical protein BJF79_12285 [Actinomadura sp. CNU-125]
MLSARGHAPAAETGTDIADSPRPAGSSRTAPSVPSPRRPDAGAHADVWKAIVAALPPLLPEPGTRAPSGLPDLLALGTRTAETVRARGTVPGLADVAARGGSSRLVAEAARLHRALTEG